jgi:hypothetical protein
MSRDVPITEGIDPLWVLANESQVAVWQNEGMHHCFFSLEVV